MLSKTIVLGAFAVLAAAVPMQQRAVTVTDVTEVYTTVYEDASDATSTPAAASTTSAKWWWSGGHKSKTSITSEAAAETTSVSVAPAATSTSVYTPPAPTSTSVYTPPAPTTTSTAAAVTTTPVYTPAATTTATPTSSTSAAASVSAASGSYLNAYAQAVQDHHNAHRANHSAPNIAWDDATAATAMKIAQTCVYEHNTQIDNADGSNGYGQNIAAGCPASNISSVITELFYNNEMENYASLYGQATPSNIDDTAAFDGYGHFTQIVWKATTLVGCATYDCTGKGNGPKGLGNVADDVSPIFTVCNYKSAGNFLGEFDTNVGQPLGHPEIHWNS